MGTPGAQLGGACVELWYLPPYSVEDYIQSHLPKINTRLFVIAPSGQGFTIRAGYEERETAYVGLCKSWNH